MKIGDKPTLFLLFFSATLYFFLFIQSQGIEGGQDSWNHFLISKYAIKYPNLLLDQWNKPVFTWVSVLICQMGINALIVFNFICLLLGAYLSSDVLKKLNVQHHYLSIPLLLFSPIVLGNAVSGLTEPLNLLLLVIVLHQWAFKNEKTAVLLASFLPYLRTEGFVICAAFFVFILINKKYKLLLWLFIGSLVMNIVGYIITKKPLWIITENPYLKFELNSSFDPGNGSLLHFVNKSNLIFGIVLVCLFLISLFMYFKSKWNKHDFILLNALVFGFYFAAHTLIYYLGILGSHGLTRVMLVVVPNMVFVSFVGINGLLSFVKNKKLQTTIIVVMVLIVIQTGYAINDYAKPYKIKQATVKSEKANEHFVVAGEWLKSNHLMERRIVHQAPFFNVKFNKDPYNVNSTYYTWSIDKSNDWTTVGTIVIWDGFYAIREGGLPLDWLKNNSNYRQLHYIKGEGGSNPEMFDMYIFEKVK
mgnify:CR=1 FL=1